MRCKIEGAAIGLGLYDSAGRHALGSAMHKDFTDAFARYEQDGAGVKFARQPWRFNRRNFHCSSGKQGNPDVRV
jgi:hypothetical protein